MTSLYRVVLSILPLMVDFFICLNVSAQDWPPSKESAKESAREWLQNNSKDGPDSNFVRDMAQVVADELDKDMNVNFFFGSELMESGKFHSLHVFANRVVAFDMSSDQAAAMGLESTSATVTTSGSMGTPADKQSFELSQVIVRNSDSIGAREKFSGKINCKALADSADGEFALRVTFRGSNGVSQFQYLDAKPDSSGTTLEFEFGPVNDDDAESLFVGPVALLFDIVTVDQSGGDVKIYSHSNIVGTLASVKE